MDTNQQLYDILIFQDEEGKERRFHYYILVDHLEQEGYSGESYGLKIEEEETGQVAVAPHVTSRCAHINQLAQTLLDHQVTPCTLIDVIQDWL